MKEAKYGDEIIVKVGGKEYKTIVDEEGVQRFPENKLLCYMSDEMIDLNKLAIAFQRGTFTQDEYLQFYMGIGYSVCGLSELSFFEDLEIENPLWEDD